MHMFNLDQAISEWRRQMSAAGIKSSDVLDELESHLRDDVEQRIRGGASAEDAFRQAVVQVGSVGQLQLEFAKVSRLQPRLSRKTLRLACAATGLFVLLTQGWYLMESDVGLLGLVVGFVWVTMAAAYTGFLPALNRLLPGVPGFSWRLVLGKMCSMLVPAWVVLLYLDLAHIHLVPSGAVMSVLCWSLFVAAAITGIVLAYGTEPEALNLWTPAVWQSFELAGAEAVAFHHDFIGTEHVLLGLLGDENGTVRRALENLGVRRETVRAEIEKIVASGPQLQRNRPAVYTPRARKAFQFAIREARAAGVLRAEPEHVLLGLLEEGSGVAAKVLNSLGVDTKKAREQIHWQAAEGADDHA